MTIESRGSWGAKPPKASPTLWSPGMPQGLVGHWVGGGSMRLETVGHEFCRIAARSVQDYEMRGEYIDVAYNIFVCPHGVIMEGRGLRVRGAANGPSTNSALASACELAGVGDVLTDGARRAFSEARGHFPGVFRPHRDVNATSCPGDDRANWIRGGGAAPGGPLPAPMPQNPSPGAPLIQVYAGLHLLGFTILTWRTNLRRGSTGKQVADWQFALVGVAGQAIAIDGDFGPRTDEATRNFQRFLRLQVDGIVGPQTRSAMSQALLQRFK